MKTILILVITVFSSTTTFAQKDLKSAQSEIKEVIQSAYIDGIHNLGDIAAIEKGFHPRFSLPMLINNEIKELPIKQWIESTKRKKASNPNGLPENRLTTVKYLNIDVSGNAAVAKIQLDKGGKPTYIDYLSLYKFEEGWRIVGKIYFTLSN